MLLHIHKVTGCLHKLFFYCHDHLLPKQVLCCVADVSSAGAIAAYAPQKDMDTQSCRPSTMPGVFASTPPSHGTHDDDTVQPHMATFGREGNDVLHMPKSAAPQDGKRLHNTAFAVDQQDDHKLIATIHTTILHNAEGPIHNQAAAAAESTQIYTEEHAPETADVASRRAESEPNDAGQVRPSVAVAENSKKWSTVGGAGMAAAQGNRQPVRRRLKVQGDSVAAAICLGNSDNADAQVRMQQSTIMPTGMLHSGTDAARKRRYNTVSEKT